MTQFNGIRIESGMSVITNNSLLMKGWLSIIKL